MEGFGISIGFVAQGFVEGFGVTFLCGSRTVVKNGFSKKGLWKSSTSFSQDKPIFLVFGENFTFAIRNKYVANELLNENCAKKGGLLAKRYVIKAPFLTRT